MLISKHHITAIHVDPERSDRENPKTHNPRGFNGAKGSD